MTGVQAYISIRRLINVGISKPYAFALVDELKQASSTGICDTRKAYHRLKSVGASDAVADVLVEMLWDLAVSNRQ
jgi:hypothetical protein